MSPTEAQWKQMRCLGCRSVAQLEVKVQGCPLHHYYNMEKLGSDLNSYQ